MVLDLVGSRPSWGMDSTPSGSSGAQSVVLVHGAYADGSSWSSVIPYLLDAGLSVTAVQHSLESLQDSVDATRRALALFPGPTVLVGHSFAGTIISEAGVDDSVAGLVYVAARGPDAGEDYGELAAKYPAAPASAGLKFADGEGRLDQDTFVRDFASDLPRDRALALHAVQGPVSETLFKDRTTQAAWRSKPTWYAISTADRTINPELQKFMAARMGATQIELDSSHLSMLSHPSEVAQLILTAARSV